MKKITINFIMLLAFMQFGCVFSQIKESKLEGFLVNEMNAPISFASINVSNSNKGTITNQEGMFSLFVSEEDLEKSLTFNCLGYESLNIKIKDFITKNNKRLVLKEKIILLSEVEVLPSKLYVNRALQSIRNNTVSKRYELKMLYRRASSEEYRTRFFVEQYIKVAGRGVMSRNIKAVQVLESRKSPDYRFLKKDEKQHAIIPMIFDNPISDRMNLNNISWRKIGDTNYDDEDVVVIQGMLDNKDTFKLFIGLDTYGIYRIENKRNNAIYIYKKNENKKLYLAYHSRESKDYDIISKEEQKLLGLPSNSVATAYNHEVFVLDIETNKKNIKIKHQPEIEYTDMTHMGVPYHASFWSSFVAPPDTNYFKKIKNELEYFKNTTNNIAINK